MFLLIFLPFLAASIYVFKKKEVSYINKHSYLKENILEKTREAKKNNPLNTSNSKKNYEEKINNTQSNKKRKEKFGIKPINESYQNLSFSIADVSEEEVNRWRVQSKEPDGFALSSLILKVNKRNLLKNEKLKIPLNKKEFVEVKRIDFDLENKDSFVWQGISDSENKLDSNKKTSSSVLLSWYKGSLTGYLNLSREESYQISSFKKGYIIINKINPAFFPKEEGRCSLPLNKKQSHIDSKEFLSDSSKNVLKRRSENINDKVKILFFYKGNEYNIDEIRSKVNGYISSLNTILKNQDISVSNVFEKAGIIEMIKQNKSLENASLADTLIQMSAKENFVTQELRHDYQADLISILVQNHDEFICGLNFSDRRDYIISAIACDSKYTFEHEIGHALGASHERKQLRSKGRLEKSPYAYGYYNEKKKTIMAYYCWDGDNNFDCDRVKYYSSSDPNFIGNSKNDVAREIKENLSNYKARYENWLKSKKPRIVNDLDSRYIALEGSNITLRFVVENSYLLYKWYKNGRVLNGETSSSLRIENLNSSHRGTYKVEASNYFGSVFSKTAELKIGKPPRITEDLKTSYVASLGSNITLSVVATGTNLSYQWYKGNKKLNGETNRVLSITKLNSSHAGTYKVKLSNDFGSVFSKTAELKIGKPPRITEDLKTSYVASLGSNITLSVVATGTNLSYQWYKGNQVLNGETNRALSITKLNSSHGGTYKVKLSNDFGSVFSREARLIVGDRPTITRNLNSSYKKSPGSTVTFSVTAIGTGSLSYQWYKGNKKLNGETNRVLSIANLNSSHAGNYKVEVKNDFDSIYSRIATLIVGDRPTITRNLNSSYKKSPGSTVTFSVTAIGTGSLSYQWYKGNKKLNGETNRVLSIANLNSSHAGNYKVEVKNDFDSIYSRIATLIVGDRPTITRNLNSSYKKSPGSTVTFSVTAIGTGSLSYQWYKGNKKLNGETNRVLSIANLNSSHAGNYKVEVKNDFASIYSRLATLIVGNRPTITRDLNSAYKKLSGSRLTLSVTATGTGSLSYQWYKGNSKLIGKTNRVLSIANLNSSHAGNYKVEVKNDFGSVFSRIARLSVGNRPIITRNLNLSYQKSPGSTVTFSVTATGTDTLSYQWYKGNSKLIGKTNRVLSIANLNSSHAGNYKVEVKNDFDSVFSRIATLIVGNRPTITIDLNPTYKKSLGSRLTLSVTAIGAGSLSYQWYKGNKKLNGETNRVLSIANLNSSHAGNYKVEVKNDFDSIYSRIARLIVGNRPTITIDLNSTYKKSLGSRLTLSVTATGTGSLSYQWYKGNKKLNGETNRVLSIANLNSSHAGNYKVEVKNDFDSIYSRIARLIVGNRPTITIDLNSTYKKSLGSRLTLSVTATGTGSLSYQWYKGNSKLIGKTNRVLSIANLNSSHAGSYKVEVKNNFDSIFSNVATLIVGNRPTITIDLNSTYKKSLGSRLTLSVTATGTGSLSYQWYKGNKKLNGETNRVLTITKLSSSQEGTYKVKVSNNFGSVFSTLAQLKIGYPPRITKDLNSIYKRPPGSRLTLSVSATGTNLSYQWYKDNQVLSGRTSSTLILVFDRYSLAVSRNYRVEVKNDFGTISSKTSQVLIKDPPRITKDLNSIYKMPAGSTLTLSVSATGAGTLSYQWYKDNRVLSGHISSTLILVFNRYSLSVPRSYRVEVKNDFGTISSNTSQVLIGNPPRIRKDLKISYITSLGSNLTLSVVATGGNLSYQWYKDNKILNGQRSSTLNLTKLNSSHGGNYKVEISNDFDKISSIISKVQILPFTLSKITETSIHLSPENLITKINEKIILRTDTKKQNIESYVWYRDESYMATTSEPFYTVETGPVSQVFSYRLVVIAGGKAYFSNIATVDVIKPLTRNISSENAFELDTRGGF